MLNRTALTRLMTRSEHLHREIKPVWLQKPASRLERIVHAAIPALFIALLVLIILEFTVDTEHYEPWLGIADGVVVSFFMADLVYKWLHTKRLVPFLKHNWLDIVAVFPFYLVFRAVIGIRGIVGVAEEVSEAQKIAHEAAIIREAELITKAEREAKVAREAELVAKEARGAGRAVRVGSRGIRIMRTRWWILLRDMIHWRESRKSKSLKSR